MTVQISAATCECGHSVRMHVRGASPQYAGCMVVVRPATDHQRKRHCGCLLTPEAAALSVDRPAGGPR